MLFFYNCAQYLTIFSLLWAIIGHVFLRWCLYLSQSIYFFPNLIKQQQLWWSVRTKYFFHERFLFDIRMGTLFFAHLMMLFSTSNVLPISCNLQLIYLESSFDQWSPLCLTTPGQHTHSHHLLLLHRSNGYINYRRLLTVFLYFISYNSYIAGRRQLAVNKEIPWRV